MAIYVEYFTAASRVLYYLRRLIGDYGKLSLEVDKDSVTFRWSFTVKGKLVSCQRAVPYQIIDRSRIDPDVLADEIYGDWIREAKNAA